MHRPRQPLLSNPRLTQKQQRRVGVGHPGGDRHELPHHRTAGNKIVQARLGGARTGREHPLRAIPAGVANSFQRRFEWPVVGVQGQNRIDAGGEVAGALGALSFSSG
jgi:hypothetical protein